MATEGKETREEEQVRKHFAEGDGNGTKPTGSDVSGEMESKGYDIYIPNYDKQAGVMHVIAIATLIQAMVFIVVYLLDGKVAVLPTDPFAILGIVYSGMGFLFLGITWVLRHVKDCPCNANGGTCLFAKKIPKNPKAQDISEKYIQEDDVSQETEMPSVRKGSGEGWEVTGAFGDEVYPSDSGATVIDTKKDK